MLIPRSGVDLKVFIQGDIHDQSYKKTGYTLWLN